MRYIVAVFGLLVLMCGAVFAQDDVEGFASIGYGWRSMEDMDRTGQQVEVEAGVLYRGGYGSVTVGQLLGEEDIFDLTAYTVGINAGMEFDLNIWADVPQPPPSLADFDLGLRIGGGFFYQFNELDVDRGVDAKMDPELGIRFDVALGVVHEPSGVGLDFWAAWVWWEGESELPGGKEDVELTGWVYGVALMVRF